MLTHVSTCTCRHAPPHTLPLPCPCPHPHAPTIMATSTSLAASLASVLVTMPARRGHGAGCGHAGGVAGKSGRPLLVRGCDRWRLISGHSAGDPIGAGDAGRPLLVRGCAPLVQAHCGRELQTPLKHPPATAVRPAASIMCTSPPGRAPLHAPCTRGKAESSSSAFTPSSASAAGGISSKWSTTGCSGPSAAPRAIMAQMA